MLLRRLSRRLWRGLRLWMRMPWRLLKALKEPETEPLGVLLWKWLLVASWLRRWVVC